MQGKGKWEGEGDCGAESRVSGGLPCFVLRATARTKGRHGNARGCRTAITTPTATLPRQHDNSNDNGHARRRGEIHPQLQQHRPFGRLRTSIDAKASGIARTSSTKSKQFLASWQLNSGRSSCLGSAPPFPAAKRRAWWGPRCTCAIAGSAARARHRPASTPPAPWGPPCPRPG